MERVKGGPKYRMAASHDRSLMMQQQSAGKLHPTLLQVGQIPMLFFDAIYR